MIFGILALIGLGAALIAAFCAAISYRFTTHALQSVMAGSLIVPLGFCVVTIVAVAISQEVDSPPPGMVFAGIFTLAGMMLPCTTLASFLAIRIARRR